MALEGLILEIVLVLAVSKRPILLKFVDVVIVEI